MEVHEGHRAEEKAQPRFLGGLATASRFAMLGMLMTIGGDDLHVPTMHGRTADHASNMAPREPLSTDDLAIGSCIVGKKFCIPVESLKRTVAVSVERRDDGGLQLTIDGKSYRIESSMMAPCLDVSSMVNDIVIGEESTIRLVSNDHGIATVRREQIDQVIAELSGSMEARRTFSILARFRAKQGSATDYALQAQRAWQAVRGETAASPDDEKYYEVVFERIAAEQDALAMARPGQ